MPRETFFPRIALSHFFQTLKLKIKKKEDEDEKESSSAFSARLGSCVLSVEGEEISAASDDVPQHA